MEARRNYPASPFRWPKRVAIAGLASASACALLISTGVAASGAATVPKPVKTTSGTYEKLSDPGALLYKGGFYALGTGTGLREAWSSTGAGGPWTTAVNRLSSGNTIPRWVKRNTANWAPDIISVTAKRFVVYYSAVLSDGSGRRCIGAAVGSTPRGPFTMLAGGPLSCPVSSAQDNPLNNPGHMNKSQGLIDAAPVWVTISGQRRLYLLYKSQGLPATIRMVRLSAASGTAVLGKSHELVFNKTTTVEAPSLAQHGKFFILFVAHGAFNHCRYATWWFKSANIWTWNSGSGRMLMDQPATGLCGPGTGDATASLVSGQWRFLFDGWTTVNSRGQVTSTPATDTEIANGKATRVMYVRVLSFAANGTPRLGEYLGQ